MASLQRWLSCVSEVSETKLAEGLAMGTPDMRVDEGALGWDPAEVTVPAVSVPPVGPDALSKKINEAMPSLATEVVEQVTSTRAREERFAANLASARSAYHRTDGVGQQGIEAASRRMEDSSGTATPATAAGGNSLSSPAGSNQFGGQFGQLVSMAMQAGQQAMQMPLQAVEAAGQAPQGVMQGLQAVVQQSGQSDRASDPSKQQGGSTERGPDEALSSEQRRDGLKERDEADHRDDEKPETKADEASGGGDQRAPDAISPAHPTPEVGRHRRPTTPPEVAL